MRIVFAIAALVVCTSTALASFDSYSLLIGNPQGGSGQTAPYFYATLDAAGYSDWIWYGASPIHDHDYHEVLSGEWAAAIYYDGISTDLTADPNDGDRRQAMWLTKHFDYPNWPTNSNFQKSAGQPCEAWYEPTNPSPLLNTGQSTIRNNKIEITIDYEVVDLEGLGSTYSPMSFLTEPNSVVAQRMYSDRYVFLQTYTIQNVSAQTMTGLEFYQMLHSHGADEYGAQVNSTYTDALFSDPLALYTPIDSVHDVGNFRYDITQWNTPPFAGWVSHADYVGFSSTVEPDWIDNDTYKGHSGKPASGTHVNVEQHKLNGIDCIFNEEVCGAMGWSLGSLDPNETTSMTIAFMCGPEQDAPSLALNKTDDAQSCVSPEDELTYTISWQNLGEADAESAVLVDYLPAGVDYPAGWPTLDPNFVVIPGDPAYDTGTHSYRWDLGTIPASGYGSVQLTVVVNDKAEPGMPMRNDAVLTTSQGNASVQWATDVCCWDQTGIIYVNCNAQGADIGTSWADAYTDLQRGLRRAAESCGTEIWVAQGTYDPGRLPATVFTIPANVAMYGGFAGNETSREQRNPNIHRTILTGGVDAERNETVVKMGQDSLLDGFVVTASAFLGQGIYASSVDCSIANCTVERNGGYGVRAANGDAVLQWCTIRDNRRDGIFHQGEGSVLYAENCWIRQSGERGIHCINATPVVLNSIVSESDMNQFGNEGVLMVNPTYPPLLLNNTLAHNTSKGLFFSDNGTVSDPNGKDWPDVENCILWLNNAGGDQFGGFGRDCIAYSCIYDPNDPDGLDLTRDLNYNFSARPKFAYVDPNNVRIAYDSPCKDAGNPALDYEDQLEMDRNERVYGTTVDIGAYEVSCEDTSNEMDWNADGRINWGEFAALASVWRAHDPNDPALTDPNNPRYEYVNDPNGFAQPATLALWYPNAPKYNLSTTGYSEYAVDFADLVALIESEDWLVWQACWLQGGYSQMMPSGGESMLLGTFEAIAVDTPVPSERSSYKERLHLANIIWKLESLWLTDPDIQQHIDAADWQRFMDALHYNFLELETGILLIE